MNLKNILTWDQATGTFTPNPDSIDSVKTVTFDEIENFYNFLKKNYIENGIDFKINDATYGSLEKDIVKTFIETLKKEWDEKISGLKAIKATLEKYKTQTNENLK